MTRLEAIKASPLGYAKRGPLLATAHSLFHSQDGVTKPMTWPAGLTGATDWEPVLPETAATSEPAKAAAPAPDTNIPAPGREFKKPFRKKK